MRINLGNMEMIAAEDLGRNDRVLLEIGEMPHLVDSIVTIAPDTVVVAYSSSETRMYSARTPVVIVKEA